MTGGFHKRSCNPILGKCDSCLLMVYGLKLDPYFDFYKKLHWLENLRIVAEFLTNAKKSLQ